ncbi:MAG TPA: hypothetical protein VGG06_10530 [Thermoanaerobaculia bacterium]
MVKTPSGQAPESIVRSFPLLSLEQVYGAITYYLAHREEVDAHLEQGETDYEALRRKTRGADPAFYDKLAADADMVRSPSKVINERPGLS